MGWRAERNSGRGVGCWGFSILFLPGDRVPADIRLTKVTFVSFSGSHYRRKCDFRKVGVHSVIMRKILSPSWKILHLWQPQ